MTESRAAGPQPYADVAETHTAVVFFAGDRAYKLKKPVSTGFLDFSTEPARAAVCRREAELNARFAPDVYLGVAEIRDQEGKVCDHLVVMRRMPADRRLSALVERGEPVDGPLRQVARILAAQHAAAPRGPAISEQGSAAALARRWQDNVDQTRPLAGSIIDGQVIDEIERLARRFLAGRQPLLAARISAGRIVDGHGDLLTGDIFCLDDGPRILDCLEFDDTLRWLDGLDDAACCAMDLERLGAAGLAERFTGWYAEFSGDPAPASLHQHYVAYRAFMRAKVGCLRAGQGGQLAGAEASQLAGLALRHLQGRRGHPGARRRPARHRQDRPGRDAGRPARLDRALQRPGQEGTGWPAPRRERGGGLRPGDLRSGLDRPHLRRADAPGRRAARHGGVGAARRHVECR